MELRCDGPTRHGSLDLGGKTPDALEGVTLETNCKRKRCGAAKGVVVLHTFDLMTGAYTTMRYRDPKSEEDGHGAG